MPRPNSTPAETERPRFRIVTSEESSQSDAAQAWAGNTTPLTPSFYWKGTLVLALCGAVAFLVDLPVSDVLNRQHWLGGIHRTLELAEPMGDAAGVLLVALLIGVLHPQNRRVIPLLLLAAFSSGLLADAVKFSIGRLRPNHDSLVAVSTVWQTFTGFFPGWKHGWGNQSFPSAHTAVAWGLAVTLSALYPRGRYLFPGLAMLVALQRVETGSHYLSDVCFGAAIGMGVGGAWLTGRFGQTMQNVPVPLVGPHRWWPENRS